MAQFGRTQVVLTIIWPTSELATLKKTVERSRYRMKKAMVLIQTMLTIRIIKPTEYLEESTLVFGLRLLVHWAVYVKPF